MGESKGFEDEDGEKEKVDVEDECDDWDDDDDSPSQSDESTPPVQPCLKMKLLHSQTARSPHFCLKYSLYTHTDTGGE